MTKEEREDIINEAVERVLLRIPETIGNLMARHAQMNKLNREFYSKYPEFKDYRDVVASVIEGVESDYPMTDYKKLLEKAVPQIKARIRRLDNLDTENVSSRPNLTFRDEALSAERPSCNGEI